MSRLIVQCTFGMLWALLACGVMPSGSAIAADGPTTRPTEKTASTQPSDKKFGTPAIIRAVASRKYDRMVELVNGGADLNIQEESGITAIWFAAKLNDAQSTRFLLAHGADPNVAARSFLSPPMTPLMITKKVEIAQMLLDAKADINAHDGEGLTALTYAVVRDDAEMIAYLIKRGADLNCKDSDGDTLLQLAKKGDHEAAVKALKEAGAKE